jgi:hypothetical protein
MLLLAHSEAQSGKDVEEMEQQRLDAKVMWTAGGVMSLAAMVFLWRDLQVPPSALVSVSAVVAAVLAMARSGRWPRVAPALVGASAAVGGLWYAVTHEPILLVGIGVAWLANLVVLLRTGARFAPKDEPVRGVITWFGFTGATLIATAALYFHFVTLGFLADDLLRRLIPTFAWLALGVGFVHYARSRGEPVIRDAGFVFLFAALLKGLFYDTTHLAGWLRIVALAVPGVVLLASARLLSRGRPAHPVSVSLGALGSSGKAGDAGRMA